MSEAAISACLAAMRDVGRFAPRPRKWADFHSYITRGHPRETWPPLPLILAGHWSTTAAEKHRRLQEHLEWAASHGRLDEAIDYLTGLAEEHWCPLPADQWARSAGGL